MSVLLISVGLSLGLTACATLERGPVGNRAVPSPAKAVDLNRYLGLWYEVGRYENGFERACEAVTAEYVRREDGLIGILNTCRQGGVEGQMKSSQGRARIVAGSDNAKLKVSFFGPFYLGDYWVLDRADDYSWAIIGEPSGRYLWLMSRAVPVSEQTRATLMERAKGLGYDLSLVRETRH